MTFPLLPRLSALRISLRLGSILLKVCLFLPLPLMCQQRAVSAADIPFNFSAGKHALPAGEYVIYRVSDFIYSLRSKDGAVTEPFVVYSASSAHRPADSKLVFRKYGGQYLLTSLWFAGSQQGFQIRPTKAEVKLFAEKHQASSQDLLVAVDLGNKPQNP
jgi:hypothetical protein